MSAPSRSPDPAAPLGAVPVGARPGVGARRDWQVHRRAISLALALAGTVAMAASYFRPWWNFLLVAPQYPQGLNLVVALTGVTGDTEEVGIINHYIGMAHLEAGAPLERAFGGYAVALLVVMVIVGMLVAGRKVGWISGLMGLGFPIGFLADTMYWLYTFGHDLDPKAPVHIKPFTPNLFGTGKVGQFHTTATPMEGFALAVFGVVLVGLAVWQRSKVCQVCPLHDTCGKTCPRAFVGVPR